MNIRAYIRGTVILSLVCISQIACADLIILKNGNQLKVEKSWQEDGQVWFIFGDLKASIPQSKVNRVQIGTTDRCTSPPPTEDHPDTANQICDPLPAHQNPPDAINRSSDAETSSRQGAGPVKKYHVLRKDGFDDLKWGTLVIGIRGLNKRQTDSGLKEVIEYVRPQDPLRLGNTSLKSIVYAFWRDELYTVTVWTHGLENYEGLRRTVFDTFGQGTQPDPASERYLWTDGLSDMMLKYLEEDQYGMLWMRSKELDRKFKLSQLNGHTSYLKWMKSKNKH